MFVIQQDDQNSSVQVFLKSAQTNNRSVNEDEMISLVDECELRDELGYNC